MTKELKKGRPLTLGVSLKLKIVTESLKANFCQRDVSNWPKKKTDTLFGAAQQVKACWA